MPDKIRYAKFFWAVFFYAVIVSVLVQFLILPHLVPGIHAGFGLMKNHDWVTFHNDALRLIEVIRVSGWSAWSLRPENLVETGLIAPFYYFITPRPWVLIPVNALIHATSAVLMLHILHKLVRLDGLKAWLAILFFCVLPTSLLWVTQIHKDGLVFLSSFLFLFGTQKALGLFNDGSRFWRGFGSTFTLLTLGILIGWVARPYLVDVFVLVLLALAFYFTGKGLVLLFLGKKKSIVSYCVPLGLIFLSGLTFKVLKGVSLSPVPLPTQKIVGLQSFYIVKKEGEEKATPSTNTTSFFPSEIEQEKAKSIKVEENTALHRDPWTFTWWIPNFVDRRLYTMSQIRLGYSRTPGASNFDTDKQFLSAKELLQYVPRAFQIMFFAPFPSFFQKEGVELGFFRKAVFLEVLLSYLLFPLFILQWIRNRKNEAYWLFVLTTLSFMFVYTITVINLGTLHRFRYGFYHLLLASGIPLLWELKRVFKREKFKTLRVEDACLNPA